MVIKVFVLVSGEVDLGVLWPSMRCVTDECQYTLAEEVQA